MLASHDSVALDTVVADLIGLDARKVHTIRYSGERHLGQSQMDRISVHGKQLDDIRVADFKLTSNTGMELLPKFLVRLIDPLLWMLPKVNEEECIMCGECVSSCPTDAMRRADEDSVPYVVEKKCINCWCCHEICPSKAVFIDKSWLAKRLIR